MIGSYKRASGPRNGWKAFTRSASEQGFNLIHRGDQKSSFSETKRDHLQPVFIDLPLLRQWEESCFWRLSDRLKDVEREE